MRIIQSTKKLFHEQIWQLCVFQIFFANYNSNKTL
jgi:hypothetical protein